jgi:hypothetical protein
MGQPCCNGTSTLTRYCSAPASTCIYVAATGYSCQPCGGLGQACCGPNSSGPATSTTGTCTTAGQRCTYTGLGTNGYTCM